jgi:hypothetical protein
LEETAIHSFPNIFFALAVTQNSVIRTRLETVWVLLIAETIDRSALNDGLRILFKSIDINTIERTLRLKWKNGDESLVSILPPSFSDVRRKV